MKAARKVTRSTSPPATLPLYKPTYSVRRNQHGSWSVWWRAPERQPDGSVSYHPHGKVIANKGCTEEQAREKADAFLSRLKIPLVEDAAIEKVRADVEVILAKQQRDAKRPKQPETPKIGSLAFTPPAVYLLDSSMCSQRILGEYLVGRLGEAASLRKGIEQMQARLIECEAETMFGSWLMHNREALLDNFRKQARSGSKVLEVPNRAQAAIAEMAQRLLGTSK